MKRKAGSLSPPTATATAKGASSSCDTTSSSSSDESEDPTLSTDSSLKEARADGDGDGGCTAVKHAAATPPRTPRRQMNFHRSSPGSAGSAGCSPGQSRSAAASRQPTPKAPRKKKTKSPKIIKAHQAAAAAAEKETEETCASEAEESEEAELQDLPDGPETYEELFAYPRMNALELLQYHRDHESHCNNFKKVLQNRLIQHDSFSGLGTASITCRRQLEAMVAAVNASHLDWTDSWTGLDLDCTKLVKLSSKTFPFWHHCHCHCSNVKQCFVE